MIFHDEGQVNTTIEIHLQNSEVFKNTIHHVFFRQMFEFVDKVDHVFTHRGAVDPINAFSSFQTCVLCLQNTQSIAMPLVKVG